MKSVDTGKDKVKKICEVLKRETLEPAKKEADSIIQEARKQAAAIVDEAKQEAKKIHEKTKQSIEEERNVFNASIHLACKNSLLTLKQEVEGKLFNSELSSWIEQASHDPHLLSQLITAIVKGIEKDGLDADLEALIPSVVSTKAVNQLLIKGILEKLKQESVQVGDFSGGVAVKLSGKNLTIDMTSETLKNLVARFVREDFRKIIFETA